MSAATKGKVADIEQPASFEFTPENFKLAEEVIARYPKGKQQSAVMPLLMLAQKQSGNWLPKAAMDYVASILGMPPIRVYEVATFYSMYNLEPLGKYHVQVCTTTPCWLRGSDDVVHACESHLGIGMGETTRDGKFTLTEVECLGACVNAPMVQITSAERDEFFEDLNGETTRHILEQLEKDRWPAPGPQVERQTSAPQGGPTTLREVK